MAEILSSVCICRSRYARQPHRPSCPRSSMRDALRYGVRRGVRSALTTLVLVYLAWLLLLPLIPVRVVS